MPLLTAIDLYIQRARSRTPTTTSIPVTSELYAPPHAPIWLTFSLSRIDISPEFSFDHMLEFSKLAVAFAVELGGWAQ